MKKIICLLVILSLTAVAQAGDKKKKNQGGGGRPAGGGHAPSMSHGGGGGSHNSGGQKSRPNMSGQREGGNPMGGHSSMGSQASHRPTRATGNAGGKTHSNPMMAKHGNAGGSGHANPMLTRKGSAGAKGARNNPMKTNQAAKGWSGNKMTRNQHGNLKGNRQAFGGKANRRGLANRGRGNARFAHNYRVRPYREVYHNYHAVYHDRGWYSANYDRVVLVGGGYYYWDGGYWFPAWGYDPAVTVYAYSEPIYSYDNLPPDEVVVNVQTELQDEGYYTGEVDGQMGPQTRDAVSAYQRDHDLEVTAAIDEPTVDSLGLNS